jgi:hypothetical protein
VGQAIRLPVGEPFAALRFNHRSERLPAVSGAPVIAKIILPWFGGSAAVWTTCLLFFQLVLLLGYSYAHAVVRYLKPKTQMLVHGALLLLSAASLPIYPHPEWKPSGTEPPSRLSPSGADGRASVRLWTDDYSNLFHILK